MVYSCRMFSFCVQAFERERTNEKSTAKAGLPERRDFFALCREAFLHAASTMRLRPAKQTDRPDSSPADLSQGTQVPATPDASFDGTSDAEASGVVVAGSDPAPASSPTVPSLRLPSPSVLSPTRRAVTRGAPLPYDDAVGLQTERDDASDEASGRSRANTLHSAVTFVTGGHDAAKIKAVRVRVEDHAPAGGAGRGALWIEVRPTGAVQSSVLSSSSASPDKGSSARSRILADLASQIEAASPGLASYYVRFRFGVAWLATHAACEWVVNFFIAWSCVMLALDSASLHECAAQSGSAGDTCRSTQGLIRSTDILFLALFASEMVMMVSTLRVELAPVLCTPTRPRYHRNPDHRERGLEGRVRILRTF